MKIISLVPSLTELLYDLGLDEEVIGITKFCIHPNQWYRSKTRIGGTKTLDLEKIKSLKPDIIIANKEENEKHQIEQLLSDYHLILTDITTLNDCYHWISEIGKACGKYTESQEIIHQIKTNFQNFTPSTPKKVVYLIWNQPIMTVGNDTFINEILHLNHFKNSFEDLSRYPCIEVDDIQKRAPDLLLLSSEPFPFKQKHVDDFQKKLPNTKIIIVDGEAFSWYGSRILHTPNYLQQLNLEINNP